MYEELKRKVFIISLKNLVLDKWEIFNEILYESKFFEKLTMPPGENKKTACDLVCEKLQKNKVDLTDLAKKEVFYFVWKMLKSESNQKIFYRQDTSRKRFNDALKEADSEEFYREIWLPIAELFNIERKKCLHSR